MIAATRRMACGGCRLWVPVSSLHYVEFNLFCGSCMRVPGGRRPE